MFPPKNNYDKAMIYNFRTKELRPIEPDDRLYNHVAEPFHQFRCSASALAKVDKFISLLVHYTIHNGGLLDDDEGAEAHALLEMLPYLFDSDEFPWMHNFSKQWVTPTHFRN